jgi:DNA-binding MarR family transcriptional regulator
LHTQISSVNRLSLLELAAWRGLLRVHAGLVRELDAELQAAHGLPLHEYEVLLTVDNASAGRLRMTELASSVLLSQSGLTRLVDRLERDGLVERERCTADRRGFHVRLTGRGRELLELARATHLAGVRARFLSSFSAEELVELAGFWERVVPGSAATHEDERSAPIA